MAWMSRRRRRWLVFSLMLVMMFGAGAWKITHPKGLIKKFGLLKTGMTAAEVETILRVAPHHPPPMVNEETGEVVAGLAGTMECVEDGIGILITFESGKVVSKEISYAGLFDDGLIASFHRLARHLF
jgi:hypothetical protein